jgi:hypothetical protein
MNTEHWTINNEDLSINDQQWTINNDHLSINNEHWTINNDHVLINNERLSINNEYLTINNVSLTVLWQDASIASGVDSSVSALFRPGIHYDHGYKYWNSCFMAESFDAIW